MTRYEALTIVLDLATENMAREPEQEELYRKQAQAMDIVLEIKQEMEF